MDLTFVNLTEKPELTAAMWAVHSTWPEFMVHEPLADRYCPRLAATFPEHLKQAVRRPLAVADGDGIRRPSRLVRGVLGPGPSSPPIARTDRRAHIARR
jgi:hypothetical protein